MDRIKKIIIFALILVLSGCTTLPEDKGISDVHTLLNEHGIKPKTINSQNTISIVNKLISNSISIDNAIQLALINNAELNKTYTSLGIAAADVYEAGRIRNPIFSFSKLDSNESGERDLVTLSLVTSLSDLITLPSRKHMAESQFAIVKKNIAADILRILNEVQIAFYEYAGSLQIQSIKQHQYKTAMLSARLSERYYQAGNISEREKLEEISKASSAMFEAFQANADALAARTELANSLGLNIEESWQINSAFPIPDNTDIDIDKLRATAMKSRMDLNAAQLETERLAKQLGITNWTRYLGDLDIGLERERETDGAKLFGSVLEWEVPIFSQNSDKKLRVASEFKIALLETKRISTEIQNEIYANYLKTKSAQTLLIEYQHNFIPNQVAIVSRAQEEENFMLIGAFELIEFKQQEYESYIGLVEALQSYWTAYANLMYAAGDSLSSPSAENEVFSIDTYLEKTQSSENKTHIHH